MLPSEHKYSKKQIVRSLVYLDRLLKLRFVIDGRNHNRYGLLPAAINYDMTPQGSTYWNGKYFWFAEQDITGSRYANSDPMTDADWEYLEYLGKESKDHFLTEKENKEYVDFAIDLQKKK